jgi:hypothetical protein
MPIYKKTQTNNQTFSATAQKKIGHLQRNSCQIIKALSLAFAILHAGFSLADAPPPAKAKIIKQKPVKKVKKTIKKNIKKAKIKTEKLAVVRLQPQIRSTELEPSVMNLNPAFLKQLRTQFKLIDVDAQNNIQWPRIIGGDEGQRIFTQNDYIYVQGASNMPVGTYKNWHIVKVAAPIYSQATSEATSTSSTSAEKPKLVAYRVLYRANAVPADSFKNNVERFLLTNSSKEADVGDYLLPALDVSNMRLTPYTNSLNAKIINLENIDNSPNQGAVALINKGKKDGLILGSQLEVYSAPKTADLLIPELETQVTKIPKGVDKTSISRVDLPQIKKSTAIVFDATEQVSYVYIPYAERLISQSDVITNIKP